MEFQIPGQILINLFPKWNWGSDLDADRWYVSDIWFPVVDSANSNLGLVLQYFFDVDMELGRDCHSSVAEVLVYRI